jgi:beta-lactamase regulating signal transducer with metallopeptidase domain
MTPVLDGLLFDRAWICTSAGAAVAAVSVAALALVVGRALRGRPAPLRYGLLLAALVVLGIVPVVAAASRLGGWGAVRISNATVDRPLSPRPFLVPPAVPRHTPVPDSSPREEAVRPERVAEPAVVPMRVPTVREVASCLLWVWLGVLVFSVGRMVRDLLRLRTLRRSLTPSPSPAAVDLLREAARSVGLTQPPRLFESTAVPVPFVIGPVRPVVVLPAGMAITLDREKLTAVLLHEAAHVAHGDLWVGLLQHAVAAVFWWCPPVHRLNRRLAEAREEICDDYVVLAQGDGFQLAEVLVEMACGLREKRQRLAIGTLGAIDEKPALEGRVERLVDLTRKAAPMTRMNRLAMAAVGAFGAAALAIVVATTIHAGDEVPAAQPNAAPTAVGDAEAKTSPAVGVIDLKVRVVDANGRPVAKAKVTPWALGSSQGHGLWAKDDKYCDLSPSDAWTDTNGIATVTYPYYRNRREQVRTIEVSLQVDHPEFAFVDDVYVEVPRATQEPYDIKLSTGVPVEVRPMLDGRVASHDNLFALWSDGRSCSPDFTPRVSGQGALVLSAMRPGANSVLLVKLDGDRATHFSRITDFDLAIGEPKQLDVELRPGACVRGTLSDNVPRPVRKGRVRASSLNPADTGGKRVEWNTWAPIQPDGTFVIDSWPADEPIQLIALCDGFIAANGIAPEEVANPPAPGSDRIGRPQVFRPSSDGRIELAMSPLVRCNVTAVDTNDQPVEGVEVLAWPNVGWWNSGSQIYCSPLFRDERLVRVRNFSDSLDDVFPDPWSASTDEHGKASLGLPSGNELLSVKSDAYELPIVRGNREVAVRLVQGETTDVALRLQPRGTEKLGETAATANGKGAVALLRFHKVASQTDADYQRSSQTHVVLVKDSEVLKSALQLSKIAELPCLKGEKDPIGWLTRNVDVQMQPGSEILSISVRGVDAADASAVVTAVAQAYLANVVDLQKRNTFKVRDALEQRYKQSMDVVRANLDTYNQLAKSLGTSDSEELDTQRGLLLDRLRSLGEHIVRLENDKHTVETDLGVAEKLREKPDPKLRARLEVLNEQIASIAKESDRVANEVKELGAARSDLIAGKQALERLMKFTDEIGVQLNAAEVDVVRPNQVELLGVRELAP